MCGFYTAKVVVLTSVNYLKIGKLIILGAE